MLDPVEGSSLGDRRGYLAVHGLTVDAQTVVGLCPQDGGPVVGRPPTRQVCDRGRFLPQPAEPGEAEPAVLSLQLALAAGMPEVPFALELGQGRPGRVVWPGVA